MSGDYQDEDDYQAEQRARRRAERDYGDDDDYDSLARRDIGNVPNYLVPAILVTLLCCWPAGIVAIVYAAQVDGKMRSGDYAAARSASNNAKIWCWVSFGGGLLAIVGWIGVAVVAGLS